MISTMQTSASGRRPNKRGPRIILWFLALFCASVIGAYYWIVYVPNFRHEKPDFNGNLKPVFYKGDMWKDPATGKAASLKLSFDAMKEAVDPNLLYEKSSDSTIITTQNKVVRLKTSQLTAMVNEKPFTLKVPLEKVDGKLYLPVQPLKDLYRLEIKESDETGAVLLFREGESIRWHRTVAWADKPDKSIQLRSGPTIKASIYADLKQGERVIVWGDNGEWYRVQLLNGYSGYIKKEELVADPVETVPLSPPEPDFTPKQNIKGKINMTWEQVVTKNPDTAQIPAMPGLDVVSPTWFHIENGEGSLKNLADPAYVKWAHGRGYQVWGLFSNGFDPKRTTEAIATYDKRMKMIKQLLSFAQMYNLDGINIDFENMNVNDKDELVQFVREMTPLLHEQGLIVSMAVTPRSGSESWSQIYDRKALIESLDYMTLMAYDEHWASSPKSGSVASLPWVEKSVTEILEKDNVPPSKLILGIPFYTRVWTEEVKNGKTEVKSKAVFMEMPQRIIREQQLKPTFSEETGQNYIEYKEEGKLNRIWIEDETSVKARLALVRKYGLAGLASWRRGFELPQAWDWINGELERKS